MAAQQLHPGESNTKALEFQKRLVEGESMKKLSTDRKTKVKAARLGGIVPFSILNFNPVPLKVECGIVDFTVPAATDPLGIKKSIRFGGQERIGSMFVIRNEKGFQKPVSVQNSGDPSNPQVDRTWTVVHPIEQARRFEHQYNRTDPRMGGVLIFQGDGHVLDKGNEIVIDIPETERGDDGTLIPYTSKVTLGTKLEEIFLNQKEYAFRQLAMAQSFADSDTPEVRQSVHNGKYGFTAWGQLAIDRGWKHQGELRWMVTRDADESCPRCGKGRTSGLALFCGCGRPWDAFAAFMAGEKVENEYLAALPEDKLSEVRREMSRRKKLFESFDDVDEMGVKEPKKRQQP